MAAEQDDLEFESMLRDKQHKQLLSSIKELISLLKEDKGSDEKLIQLFSKQEQSMNQFMAKLKEISVPNITPNNSEIVSAINTSIGTQSQQISESQKEIIRLLNKLIDSRNAEIEFNVTRDNFGMIDTVKASKVKPKYTA